VYLLCYSSYANACYFLSSLADFYPAEEVKQIHDLVDGPLYDEFLDSRHAQNIKLDIHIKKNLLHDVPILKLNNKL
jgi:hypothetical protein